jgi:hypothetical protein
VIRRLLRVVIRLGLVGGAGFAAFKLVQARRAAPTGMPSGDTSIMPKRSETPLVAPKMLKDVSLKKSEDDEATEGNGQVLVGVYAPATTPGAAPADTPAAAPEAEAPPTASTGGWVDPDGATCPPAHPVKAKLASGIYHLPGMTAYERTTPDRCYRDEEAAQADGLRKVKR